MAKFKYSFKNKVLNVVSKIKKGEVMTYKQVAEKAGSPRAFRAVGNILSKNYDEKIPCHRVILTSGKAGKYNRGDLNKINKLNEEGVFIK